ncbi:DsbA family protein [Amycolatopsis alkalitolerans]|uniref:Thioredoxin-like fold domain-containing protein n=1 Tax=Amycolatopsis alkalitolerans TaxID=2547244 RepID=A0A5C4LRP6_9PSEU|nr:thioredoxin domain-containing protein [Amycolatopsis alkalitolerans]TNC21445.1 hypothetical protein FG385_28410 [Amycolatopsis alkalitolerans]
MGGAERTARKRRQQQQRRNAGARAVAQARGSSGGNRKMIVAVVAVVVLAALVIGGVIWTNSSKNQTAGHAIPAVQTNASLDVPTERQGDVVVSGKDSANAKIDIYADFLCPYCGQFQKIYGSQVEQQIQAGNLQVSYHMIPLLNSQSDPPGYSLASENAALCAADQGKFTPFHDSLFAAQPEEGQRGYDNAQLIQLGKDVGITAPAFESCVNAGTYNQQLNDALQKILADPNFKGTPTVRHNGVNVDTSQADWLTKLVGQP